MALYTVNIIALHVMMYLSSVTASQLARVKKYWKMKIRNGQVVDVETIWTEGTFMSLVFDLI